MTNTRSHERLRLDYDLGKCFAKKRVQSHSSMNSYSSALRRGNSVSSTELVPGGGLSTVMLPRENKASQRRRELSEDLLRKWGIEDEMNFKYYNQLNNRARRLSQTQPNSYNSTHSISQVTVSSRDSPRSTSTPPGSRTPRRRQQELSGSYMDDTKSGDQGMMVYLTPLQRKEKNIKQLKSVLREKEVALELVEEELNSLLSEKNPELHATMLQKNVEIESLGDALSLMEQKYADLELKYQIMDETVEESQKVTTNIKKELRAREDKHHDQMVQMFKKGQQTAGKSGHQVDNSEVTDELRHQLEETQHELARVQAQQRKKNKRTDPNITESEAVTTLQFIRASLFQYLARDAREAGRHLKAMIGMMGFDEEQLEQIAYAVENKKSKSS